MNQQKRKNEYIKDNFYEELETTVTACPRNDTEILLGDYNATVGFEDQDRSAVGNCGLHKESNENGLRLIGLANALKMVIGSRKYYIPTQKETFSNLEVPRQHNK
jgi:hypothetical protein